MLAVSSMVPVALSRPSIGTHQYVSPHNAAFHSVCHLTHFPHQNNYTLYGEVTSASVQKHKYCHRGTKCILGTFFLHLNLAELNFTELACEQH